MYKYVKRIIDFSISLIGTIVLLPLIVLLSVLIKLDSKGPILFTQKRIGIHQKTFMIYKFRTMRMDTPKDQPTHLLENPDQWITRMGKFLRKTSLDELPQLLNILKGDMAIIGPRPALWNQFDLIELREKYGVHALLPGLTGYAQIKGRDEVPISLKAKLDRYYKDNFGFWFDFRIFVASILVVVLARGVVEGSMAPLEDMMDEKEKEAMKKWKS